MKFSDVVATYNPEECDLRPGAYYVSVVNGSQFGLLAGPYDSHRKALDMVAKVRKIAGENNRDVIWYGFGTCRMEMAVGPGVLNKAGLM